ncbi:uncharacterized protein LOC114535201 [Dendronephthya gigantea]|uniref:uncharacterized protein LOC114535201 n=1 Tax=Dendronephthya gigantea TaxID=151771 RepID=UPI00106B00EF|nr:uncharacterized protein LOC114535201 [Dendronephthya gigantea]
MGNEFHVAVLVVFFLTLHVGTKARYCKDVNYVTIKDARRSTAYILPHNSSSNKLCDRKAIIDDVWYRFSSEAGGDIATRRPNRGGCGTRAPIWMNGTHPTVEEGIVKRKACLDAPLVIPYGCGYSYDINVRNCSGYYIYQLKTPSQCDSVYCAGSKLPNCSNADPEDYCLANRPPYITMPDRLYAVENSTFQLVINGTDPERYPLTYEVPSSVNISIVSYDKAQKKVQIFASKSGSISLKVIDYEDLAANHTLSIQVVSCPCQNGGTCRSNKNVSANLEEVSNFTCTCLKSFSGRLCENIDQCRNLPCFPRVNCSVTGDKYYICGKCHPSMEGDGRNCKLILPNGAVAVVLTMTIISGLSWNDDLLNKTSFIYKETTAEIEIQIIKAYSDTKQFLNVIVNSYRKGSVLVVEFQIVLKKMINDAKYDPVKLLRSLAKQNKFGRFTVEPHSVRKKGTCRNNNHKNISTNPEEVSNFTCTCVKSYSGRLCENIDHCRNLPCFPRVNCSVTGDKYYTCGKCPLSMEGDGRNCKLILRDGAVAVVLTMTIISGLPWNDDLLNKTSFVYKETTAEIEIQIIKAYSDTKDFLNVMVNSYRRGSVVVEFQIVSKKAMKEPLKPLRSCVNQNKFGRFTVDPQSVSEKTTKSADDTYFGLKKAVFIAIMCIVSLLVIISIAICGICIGKKHISVVLINISDGQEREICPDGTKESGLQMKTRLSRNQVLPT